MTDLACKLDNLPDSARGLIVIEAVYSMNGHIAPLKEVIKLRDRHPNTLQLSQCPDRDRYE